MENLVERLYGEILDIGEYLDEPSLSGIRMPIALLKEIKELKDSDPIEYKQTIEELKATKEEEQTEYGEPEDTEFLTPMKIINKKSRYYGQEVKPLKELNYGANLVIQVKLENGKTEIFDPEDLTDV